MKWFFALNESCTQFQNYGNLIKVAVHTAQKFTSLEPHFLYDGAENELTSWLTERGVRVIDCRTFLYDKLEQLAEQRRNSHILTIGAGAFLRTEIPRITKELGINDEFVVYTDVDVMFCGNVDGLSEIRPKYFAVAPEMKIRNYREMNSGVMVMNVPALRSEDQNFREFMVRRLPDLLDYAWDQGAYRLYYRKPLIGFRWDRLPQIYNWKPYWPINKDAKIIHFHGPKPFQRPELTSGDPPPELKPLLPLVTENYLQVSNIWENLYQETVESSVSAAR